MRRQTEFAYGDESIRPRSYWLAVVIVPAREARNVERLVRSLHLPGQRQLHFNSERDHRRRAIINAVVRSETARGWVYRAPRPVVRARDSCLRALVADLVDRQVTHLILDRVDERQANRDRVTVREAIRKQGTVLQYRHGAPWEHGGIQIADVVAWAYGAGGDWRRRIRPLVDRVTDLD